MTLEESVIHKLKSEKIILCTIESCTGGLIANLLTDVSGASEVFWGSWVTYDNSAKIQLGVSEQTLTTHGAVSPEIATELALNGLRSLEKALKGVTSSSLTQPKRLIALSTTGIAGPHGGTPKKPVGLCYSSIISADKTSESYTESMPKTHSIQAASGLSRIQVKNYFAQKALELVLGF
jgi:PncC family amidohydrolase